MDVENLVTFQNNPGIKGSGLQQSKAPSSRKSPLRNITNVLRENVGAKEPASKTFLKPQNKKASPVASVKSVDEAIFSDVTEDPLFYPELNLNDDYFDILPKELQFTKDSIKNILGFKEWNDEPPFSLEEELPCEEPSCRDFVDIRNIELEILDEIPEPDDDWECFYNR